MKYLHAMIRVHDLEATGRFLTEGLGLTEDGRYVYGVNGNVEDYTVRQNRGESQWAAQITLRYRF